jgi:hypothetical protein
MKDWREILREAIKKYNEEEDKKINKKLAEMGFPGIDSNGNFKFYKPKPTGTLPDIDVDREPVCECGVDKAGGGIHSPWCPKANQ